MSFPIPLVVLRQPRASVSTADLARVFGVTLPTIREWAASGYLPPPTMRRGDVVTTLPRCLYHAHKQRWTIRDLVRCYLW